MLKEMSRRKITGFLLMLASSLFFILGSFWYMDLAYVGTDLWPKLSIGLTFGIPAIIIMIITWFYSKAGGIIAICLAFLSASFWLLQIIARDNEPRLIWSQFITSIIYLIGSVIVISAE